MQRKAAGTRNIGVISEMSTMILTMLSERKLMVIRALITSWSMTWKSLEKRFIICPIEVLSINLNFAPGIDRISLECSLREALREPVNIHHMVAKPTATKPAAKTT
jgi:hypothetical protein